MARAWYDRPPSALDVKRATKIALERETDPARLYAFAGALDTLAEYAREATRLRERARLLDGRIEREERRRAGGVKKAPRRRPAGTRRR